MRVSLCKVYIKFGTSEYYLAGKNNRGGHGKEHGLHRTGFPIHSLRCTPFKNKPHREKKPTGSKRSVFSTSGIKENLCFSMNCGLRLLLRERAADDGRPSGVLATGFQPGRTLSPSWREVIFQQFHPGGDVCRIGILVDIDLRRNERLPHQADVRLVP